MKTIEQVFEQYKSHPFYGKDFKKLKAIQIQFMLDYLKSSINKDKGQFEHDLNRMFILKQVEVGYDYNKVFPLNKQGKRKLVSTTQDIMSAVFNTFKGV
jgi:hypothetical protein